MKIKTTVPVATIAQCYTPGVEYDIDDAEAQLLIAGGQATASDPNYKPQPAAKPQPQTLDQKPSQPIEALSSVKAAPAAPAPVTPAAIVAPTTNAALTTDAITPTAVELAKKAGK